MACADKECILSSEEKRREGRERMKGEWLGVRGYIMGGGVIIAPVCLDPQVFPDEFTQE